MPTKGARDNFSGDLTVTAPTGGYTAGNIYQLASGAYAVARETKAAGQATLMAVLNDQPVWATKATGTGRTFSAGSKVYRNSSAVATNATTGNVLVGVAVAAAAATDTEVLLIGAQALGPAAT